MPSVPIPVFFHAIEPYSPDAKSVKKQLKDDSISAIIVYGREAGESEEKTMEAPMFNTLPKIALAPLFVIWLGYGIWPNIVIGTTIAFFPMVVNSAVGLATAEPACGVAGRAATRMASRPAITAP